MKGSPSGGCPDCPPRQEVDSDVAVPEGKSVKNRMHMDVETVDVEVIAAELEANGAKREGVR